MAVIFLDSNSGLDADNGSTWALAKLTLQAALTTAGAGGTVYAQDDASGGFTEVTAASVTYTSPGTIDNPTKLVACKSGTTNAPPLTADLVLDRDDADLAVVSVTGANDITITGYADVWGFKLTTVDDLLNTGNLNWRMHHSILDPGDTIRTGFQLTDGCEVAFAAGGEFFGSIEMIGGEITGATVKLSNAVANSTLIFSGVDFSSLGATVGFDMDVVGVRVELVNLRIPDSYIPFEAGASINNLLSVGLMIGCDNSADHTATIRQYRSQRFAGHVVDDTPFISGGAQDRDSGDGYSFSMNLNDNAVVERFWPFYTEWYEVPLDGTETSLTIEIMRKDTGAPADLDNETCWIELQSPNEGVGSATAQFAQQTSRVVDPVAATAALTSSSVTWSSLGGQTAKKQKIVFTISPEYAGVARYRVAYAERGTSILPLYFDPKPTLA